MKYISFSETFELLVYTIVIYYVILSIFELIKYVKKRCKNRKNKQLRV